MTIIACDICRKSIAGARRDVNYVAILDKEVCIPCHEDLLDTTKRQMLTRRPFLFKDYQVMLVGNLTKLTGKS